MFGLGKEKKKLTEETQEIIEMSNGLFQRVISGTDLFDIGNLSDEEVLMLRDSMKLYKKAVEYSADVAEVMDMIPVIEEQNQKILKEIEELKKRLK